MKEYIVPIYDDGRDDDSIFVGEIREKATELVRCKDCKHRPKKDGCFNNVCPCATTGDPYLDWVPEDDWFCPEGER